MTLAGIILLLSLQNTASASNAQTPSFENVARAAEQAREAGRDDEATRLFREGLGMRPEWKEGLWYLGTLLYDKESFAEARDLLRQFVAQSPEFGPGWALLGLSEFKTREYSRALAHLKRSISLGVGDRKHLADSIFYHTAVLLTRFEQYHDSLQLLWQMRGAGQAENLLEEPAGLAALGYPLLPAEIPPDRRELARLAGAGTFALFDQRRADAEKLFARMTNQYPNEPGVHYQYGTLLINDRPEAGIRELQAELQVSPSHVPARLRLAEYYLAQSQPDAAQPYIEEISRLEPANASGHMLMGEMLASKGDSAGAIRELELARKQEPGRVRIRWGLLRAYTATGRRDDARRERAEIEKLTKEQAPQ